MIPRLLIIDPEPGEHLSEIFNLCSDETKPVCCTHVDDLSDALEAGPEIVFQFKIPGLRGEVSERLLTTPSLRWVQCAGVGVDHLGIWDAARVAVCNSAGVLSDFMAEYVLGAILSANIGFPAYHRQQAAREWRPLPWTGIRGKTILIVGLGRIGLAVAARAKAFGMNTIGIRSSGCSAPSIDRVAGVEQLAALLPLADVVSIHVPLTSKTRGLFDRRMFDAFRPGAILVNTSRGGVVDEKALTDKLVSGALRAAVLDVFEREPLPSSDPLWSTPNLVITPHMSDSVADWKTRSTAFFLQNLASYRASLPLMNVVQPTQGY